MSEEPNFQRLNKKGELVILGGADTAIDPGEERQDMGDRLRGQYREAIVKSFDTDNEYRQEIIKEILWRDPSVDPSTVETIPEDLLKELVEEQIDIAVAKSKKIE